MIPPPPKVYRFGRGGEIMAVVFEQGGRLQEFLHGRESAGLVFHQLFAQQEEPKE